MRRAFVCLCAVMLFGCATQPAAPPQPINVIVFPGGFNWPIWVAQEKGFFARNGVDVRVTTPSSVFQLTNLIAGKFDIAMTAIDNLIAYRENQGEEPVYDPANKAEAIAIFRKNLPQMNEPAALTAYAVLLSPTDGFQKKARIDLQGVRTVLQLRSKYAEPKKTLDDPAKYYDASFYEQAIR